MVFDPGDFDDLHARARQRAAIMGTPVSPPPADPNDPGAPSPSGWRGRWATTRTKLENRPRLKQFLMPIVAFLGIITGAWICSWIGAALADRRIGFGIYLPMRLSVPWLLPWVIVAFFVCFVVAVFLWVRYLLDRSEHAWPRRTTTALLGLLLLWLVLTAPLEFVLRAAVIVVAVLAVITWRRATIVSHRTKEKPRRGRAWALAAVACLLGLLAGMALVSSATAVGDAQRAVVAQKLGKLCVDGDVRSCIGVRKLKIQNGIDALTDRRDSCLQYPKGVADRARCADGVNTEARRLREEQLGVNARDKDIGEPLSYGPGTPKPFLDLEKIKKSLLQ